ncbi:MAG: hypothetical protein KDD66_05230 [Bdellovibrionales bacterium]|nr:hypothetical protein [Bdellovibrionales bacterium]
MKKERRLSDLVEKQKIDPKRSKQDSDASKNLDVKPSEIDHLIEQMSSKRRINRL